MPTVPPDTWLLIILVSLQVLRLIFIVPFSTFQFQPYFRPNLLKGTKHEKTHLKSLIRRVETEAPFTALGFFDVELSTLTSIVSTVLTYLIIIIQFAPDFYSTGSSSTAQQNGSFGQQNGTWDQQYSFGR